VQRLKENTMGSILEILVDDGRFDTFVSAIQASNLADTLNSPGPFTVFAPTDDAFVGLPEGMVDQVMDDIPSLTRMITYHIVPGTVRADNLPSQDALETVHGDSITIQRMDGRFFANDALLITNELRADNGVIHAIDAVLLPSTH
jgi:uncharacterized surface protein with fasciclin (FAS1) repeats